MWGAGQESTEPRGTLYLDAHFTDGKAAPKGMGLSAVPVRRYQGCGRTRTVAFTLLAVLQHTRHSPDPGPLHQLFPLPSSPSPQTLFFQSQLWQLHLREVFLTILAKGTCCPWLSLPLLLGPSLFLKWSCLFLCSLVSGVSFQQGRCLLGGYFGNLEGFLFACDNGMF